MNGKFAISGVCDKRLELKVNNQTGSVNFNGGQVSLNFVDSSFKTGLLIIKRVNTNVLVVTEMPFNLINGLWQQVTSPWTLPNRIKIQRLSN